MADTLTATEWRERFFHLEHVADCAIKYISHIGGPAFARTHRSAEGRMTGIVSTPGRCRP